MIKDKFNKRILRMRWTAPGINQAEINIHNKWIVNEHMISIYDLGTIVYSRFNYCRHESMQTPGFRPFKGKNDFDE